MGNFNENSRMQKQNETPRTYEEKNAIKDKALGKLKELIEAELKRLHDISPNKPNIEQFEICVDNDYFSSEEYEEVRKTIEMLNKLRSNNADERNEAIQYLGITLKTHGINCPWETTVC